MIERQNYRGPTSWIEAKEVLANFGRAASGCMTATTHHELVHWRSELGFWIRWLEVCIALRDDEIRRLERQGVHIRIATELTRLEELRDHQSEFQLQLTIGTPDEFNRMSQFFEELWPK